jgi:hypothetical protein
MTYSRYRCATENIKSSNHMLSLHRLTSSVPLQPLFCTPTYHLLLYSYSLLLQLGNLLTYEDAAITRITENIMWRLPSQSIGVLAAAYRKHMSRISYLLSWWRHCTCAEVCLPSRCLETSCINSFYCCMLDRVCCGRCIAMDLHVAVL